VWRLWARSLVTLILLRKGTERTFYAAWIADERAAASRPAAAGTCWTPARLSQAASRVLISPIRSGPALGRYTRYRLTQGPKVRRSTAQSTVPMLSSLNCTATRTLPGFFKQRRGIRIDTGLSATLMSARSRIPGH
jgi:hypothetical protein